MNNGGTLWHITRLKSALSIINSGYLLPTKADMGSFQKTGKVCFTRSRNGYSGYSKFFKGVPICVIAFDSSKINSRIKPYDYIGNTNYLQNQGKPYRTGREKYAVNFGEEHRQDDWDFYDQTEERISTDKPVDVSNAITGVDVILNLDNNLESVESMAEDMYNRAVEGDIPNMAHYRTGIHNVDKFIQVIRTVRQFNIRPDSIRFYEDWDGYNRRHEVDFDDFEAVYRTVLECSIRIAKMKDNPDWINDISDIYKQFNSIFR